MSDDKELQAEGKLPDEDMCRCGHDKLYHRHAEYQCGIEGCDCLHFQNGYRLPISFEAVKAESLRKQAQADDTVRRLSRMGQAGEVVQPVNDPISGIELFELIDEEMAIQGLPTGSKRSWLSRSERFQQAFNEVAKKLRWARE